MYFNAPITLDTSSGGAAYQVAAFLAANLPAGVKLHVEPGNECWNFATVVTTWCVLQNARLGNPDGTFYQNYYAAQSVAIHEQFVAAFTAAGRAGDVIRIFGTMAGNLSVTQSVLQQAQNISAPIDEMCVAGYFNSWPTSGYSADQIPIFNAMTTDQLLDYMELNAVYGGYAENYIAPVVATLLDYGYTTTKTIVYEWSPDFLVPIDPLNGNPPGNTPNYPLRQWAVKVHPRMYGVVLQFLQAYQDAGVTLANWFELGGDPGVNAWDAYDSGNQQRGTGNASVDTINATNPQAKNQVLSESAGAVHYWSTLVVPPTVTTTTSKKIFPGRNGQIRSIGFPRGAFRLTSSR